mgnify:CR=1 FL=1
MGLSIETLQQARNQQQGMIEELSENTRRYQDDVNKAQQMLNVANDRLSDHRNQINRHREQRIELDKAIKILQEAEGRPAPHPITDRPQA